MFRRFLSFTRLCFSFLISLVPPPGLSLPVFVSVFPRVWMDADKRRGPHSVDLMALDSNTPLNTQGHPLKNFNPWSIQNSAGVNVFSQTLHHLDNAYVFPPLALTGILPRFLDSQPCPFAIVVPDPFPRRYWWPVISGRAQDFVHLG